MNQKPANFTPGIHNSFYEEEYLRTMYRSDSLINIIGRETESLNGQWKFGADLYDTCRRQGWFRQEKINSEGREVPLDFNWDDLAEIAVPSVWNLQKPELYYFEKNGVYTRTFQYTPKTEGERLLLRFEGLSYRACVCLNGKILGTHDGTSTPFNIDITDYVRQENRIVVSADAGRSPFRVPADNTDWFNYGGIYRDVCLVRLPPVYIKDWFLRLDSKGKNILADIYVHSCNSLTVNLYIDIDELDVHEKIYINNGEAKAIIPVNPDLWSPENPKLYDVKITLNCAHIDTVTDRIGFRTITVKGKDILLNGKKIFLKGVSVHEDHFKLGKTTNEEIIRSAIRDLKDMNGNFLRLAHYPHDARFAKIADEEGILLWEEIPVYWAIAFDVNSTYIDAENQLAELILRDRNRASVIIWSIGNENPDTDERLSFMSRLSCKAKQLDDSRLVSAACLCNHEKLLIEDRLSEYLDVIGINEYYGWYDPDFEKLPKLLKNSCPAKPVIISEFGADARTGHRGSPYQLWTEDKQELVYKKQIEAFKKCLNTEACYIAGATPWILYDFRCPRRFNRFQDGFNRKGLIDLDRKTKKSAFFIMQEFYGENFN